MRPLLFARWSGFGLSLVTLFLLASCNLAGELPEGPVTPIVPPPGAVATRSATLTPAPMPAVSTASADTQPTTAAVTLPVRQPSAGGGEQFYLAGCVPCHGAAGKGDGPQSQAIVANMGGKLPDFSDAAYVRTVRPVDWFNAITSGRMQKGMPPFQSLSDDQRWDTVAFLYSLSVPKERLDRGKAVYTDKCAMCHGEAGKGINPSLPDLSDPGKMAGKSQADLDAVIVSGKGTMPGLASLSQDERLAVADYVRSFSMSLDKTTAPAAGQGTMTGTLTNGTAGAQSPGNLPLTLYAISPDRNSILFTRTVTSDAGGGFVFNQLDASPMTLYAVQAEYQRANYQSDLVTFAHGDLTLTVPITVFETTTDASALRVEQMHMFFEFAPGRATIGQLFIVSNSGDRTYIGTDGTTLRFPLPPNATNVNFQDGALGGRYQPVAGGFADTEAVLPGVGAAEVLVSYDVPYDGKKLDLSLPTAYPVRNVNVLVPEDGVKLASAQLSAAGTRDTQNGTMLNFVGGNLAAGQSVALQLSGAPSFAVTGEAPAGGASASPLLIASAVLLLVAAGIVAFVWLRQQRTAAELAEEEELDSDARREELLDAIAALDDDFEAGRVHEPEYRRQRQELKAELVELMK